MSEPVTALSTEAGRRLAAVPLIDGDDAPLDLTADIAAIEREAVADLRASLAALPVSDEGERCPNRWACRERCPCHRLTDEARQADIAAHTRVTHLDRAAVLRLIEGKV